MCIRDRCGKLSRNSGKLLNASKRCSIRIRNRSPLCAPPASRTPPRRHSSTLSSTSSPDPRAVALSSTRVVQSRWSRLVAREFEAAEDGSEWLTACVQRDDARLDFRGPGAEIDRIELRPLTSLLLVCDDKQPATALETEVDGFREVAHRVEIHGLR